MTNGEKYKTEKDRIDGKHRFCMARAYGCVNCPANRTELDCTLNWLALECKEEKPTAYACLVARLHELMEQWKETAYILRQIDKCGAVAYLECSGELQQIINGDLSPIEKLNDQPNIAECERREKAIREGGDAAEAGVSGRRGAEDAV